MRKLATLRGVGLGDVLPYPLRSVSGDLVQGVDLDEFYRRSLSDGLAACASPRSRWSERA